MRPLWASQCELLFFLQRSAKLGSKTCAALIKSSDTTDMSLSWQNKLRLIVSAMINTDSVRSCACAKTIACLFSFLNPSAHDAETGVVHSGAPNNLSFIEVLYRSLNRRTNAGAGQPIAPTTVETMMKTITQFMNEGLEVRRHSPFLQAALQPSQRNNTLLRRHTG